MGHFLKFIFCAFSITCAKTTPFPLLTTFVEKVFVCHTPLIFIALLRSVQVTAPTSRISEDSRSVRQSAPATYAPVFYACTAETWLPTRGHTPATKRALQAAGRSFSIGPDTSPHHAEKSPLPQMLSR
jgi:hypothetical protein